MSIIKLEEKLDFTENAIRENVNATISQLQRDRVDTLSMDDLYRRTSTQGVVCPDHVYRPMFERIARQICLKRSFSIVRGE